METTKTASVKTEKIDPSIENALSENCNLSILFNKDGLVFSILRNDLNKFIVLGEYELKNKEADIEALFSFKEQLKGVFSTYAIGFYAPELTIMPTSLFVAGKERAYANFQFDANQDAICYNVLKTHGLVLIYSIPKNVLALVESYFPNATIQHAAAFAISHYLNLHKNKPGEHIHVNLWRNTLEIVAIKNGKLLVYNTFVYQTNEDLLYFILNVYEQLALNPETVPLKISGEIEKGSAAWTLLLTYIRFVETEERMPQYAYSHEFKSVANHHYNRVFTAATCVL